MRILSASAILALTATPLLADTSPYLLLKPWSDDTKYFESEDKPIFLNNGHSKLTGRHQQVLSYESRGRGRFDAQGKETNLAVGYRINMLETELEDPNVPSSFMDVAAAVGVKLGQVAPDWNLSLVGGLGSANDMHFDNDKALYGIASLNARWTISEQQMLDVGVAYNGNRSFLPDIPLPYAVFTHEVSPEFVYAVGLPTSMIFWRPVEQVTLQVNYFIPANASVEAAYHFTREVSAFVGYEDSLDAYRLAKEDTRLFYFMRRALAGVRMKLHAGFDLSVGGGYAFGQEFTTGRDVQNDEVWERFSDEPFLFLQLRGGF